MKKCYFKEDDIVVCCSKEYSNHTYSNLVIGYKYKVLEKYDLSANLDVWGTGLFLKCLDTGEYYKIIPFPSSLFISLDVWRERQLDKILISK
jgi:hypothetical protein